MTTIAWADVGALLLDLDGTLLAQEPVWEAALRTVSRELVARHPHALRCGPEALIATYRRVSDRMWRSYAHDLAHLPSTAARRHVVWTAALAEVQARPLSPDEVASAVDRFSAAQLDALRPDPELQHALQQARSWARLVICTNGAADDQWAKLHRIGLAPLMDGLVSGRDLGLPKPNHRLILQAAAQAATPVHRCLVIGDDDQLDLVPARELGMHTALVSQPRQGGPNPSCEPGPPTVLDVLGQRPGRGGTAR